MWFQIVNGKLSISVALIFSLRSSEPFLAKLQPLEPPVSSSVLPMAAALVAGLEQKMTSFSLEGKDDAQAGGGGYLPVSTPRRRLHEALQMEAAITKELESQGWVPVVKAGRKLDGVLVLVTAHCSGMELRVSVYDSQTCQLQEIRRTCDMDLTRLGKGPARAFVFTVLDEYGFGPDGKLGKLTEVGRGGDKGRGPGK